MQWDRETNGDWIAKGEKGHFLIWKYGNIYKGLYMRTENKEVRFRFFRNTLAEAKKLCEENHYWEGTNK